MLSAPGRCVSDDFGAEVCVESVYCVHQPRGTSMRLELRLGPFGPVEPLRQIKSLGRCQSCAQQTTSNVARSMVQLAGTPPNVPEMPAGSVE